MTTPATIRTAVAEERAKRVRFWIGGIPEAKDIAALHKHVARQLHVTVEAVEVAMEGEQA